MATKKLKKKVQRKPVARKAENPVVESARDIWLAGLGALSVAQKEGEKFIEESNKLFDKLVKEGAKLETQARKDVEGAFDDLRGEFGSRVKNIRGDVESRVRDFRGDVESRVEGIRDEIESRFDNVRKQRELIEKQAGAMRKQAAEGWDKLEGFFEERVTRVLSRVGIPTRDDIDRLNRRVQELSRTGRTWKERKPTVRKGPRKAKKTMTKKAAPKWPRRPEPISAVGPPERAGRGCMLLVSLFRPAPCRPLFCLCRMPQVVVGESVELALFRFA
jgi:poly(hydroxyalkanoate) granule-associated protein